MGKAWGGGGRAHTHAAYPETAGGERGGGTVVGGGGGGRGRAVVRWYGGVSMYRLTKLTCFLYSLFRGRSKPASLLASFDVCLGSLCCSTAGRENEGHASFPDNILAPEKPVRCRGESASTAVHSDQGTVCRTMRRLQIGAHTYLLLVHPRPDCFSGSTTLTAGSLREDAICTYFFRTLFLPGVAVQQSRRYVVWFETRTPMRM